jgi:hypothetical protein
MRFEVHDTGKRLSQIVPALNPEARRAEHP